MREAAQGRNSESNAHRKARFILRIDLSQDMAGPEAIGMLEDRYSKAALQPEDVRSCERDADGRDVELEVENDLWHDYPEGAYGFMFVEEEGEELHDLQDIWPREVGAEVEEARTEDEDEDNEGENYDPEEEQVLSDSEEEFDPYDGENASETYVAGTREGGSLNK